MHGYDVYTAALALAMFGGWHLARYRQGYACLFCGSRNGRHSDDCQWNRYQRQRKGE